jgi:hypothetical protein
MNPSSPKIISDIDVDEGVVSVKPPFKLSQERKRRYIRLEISEPVSYSILKDNAGGLRPEGNDSVYGGSILNISAGGVLIAGQSPIEEGAVVLLKMSLQDVEVIDKIIGVVKRAEADEKEWLIGIEFISRESLHDIFSQAELEVLPQNIASFDQQIKNTLNKYVYYRKVAGEKK